MKKYKLKENIELIVADKVIDKINNYRQINGEKEAGGILLGRIKSDYSRYILEDISEPCNKDKRFKYSFVRNKDKAQKIINDAFYNSNGIMQYLGEWHTHPECNPKPSFCDKKLMKDSIKETKNVSNIIFMIILGYDGSMYVGHITKDKKKLVEIFEE
ncbi:Mov34/MPN/PAD-1 family protein [Clostridium perfringens]|uniref:Mov34/MPN/PAD-1 family protein n=1 Tax=Clostridium perfringens TaxID=1502 RepID=UPI003A100484